MNMKYISHLFNNMRNKQSVANTLGNSRNTKDRSLKAIQKIGTVYVYHYITFFTKYNIYLFHLGLVRLQ